MVLHVKANFNIFLIFKLSLNLTPIERTIWFCIILEKCTALFWLYYFFHKFSSYQSIGFHNWNQSSRITFYRLVSQIISIDKMPKNCVGVREWNRSMIRVGYMNDWHFVKESNLLELQSGVRYERTYLIS